jgi:hypothetical protein
MTISWWSMESLLTSKIKNLISFLKTKLWVLSMWKLALDYGIG